MKIALFICSIMLLIVEPIFADHQLNSPFILNRNIIYNKLVLFDAHSVVNGASEPRLLFYNLQPIEPTVEQGEFFYSMGINYSYKRIGATIQYFSKRYRSGGIYSKGIDSKGLSIRGYDKSLTTLETMYAFVIVPRFVLFNRKFADIAVNVRISNLQSYSAIDISFSKKFEKIEYTALVGFESFVGMLLFVPYELATSVSFNLSSSLSMFAELNYVSPFGGENYSSGFANVMGINYSVNKFFSFSLFNHFLYNTKFIESDLPYSRIDNRIGVELKIAVAARPSI